MTAPSIAQKSAITVFAATMALGLAACGSAASHDAARPAPALKKTSATTAPDFPREPHCFHGYPCSR